MLRCAQCKQAITPGSLFCLNCGAPVRGTQPLGPLTRATTVIAPIQHNPEVATASAREDLAERRLCTVLFTEVSGLEAMNEHLDPEHVNRIVNGLYSALTDPIYRYGGVIDKYIVNVVMAVFGAPIAHEDDAERAVRAAYEMQLAAKAYLADLEAQTGLVVRIRIGLNTGLVVAGLVGGQEKQDVTVMGDTVNLAQRMEANAPIGGILITEETYRHIRQAFRIEEKGPLQVKNRKQPVLTYEVLGPARELETQSLPILGRDEALATMGKAWSDTLGGTPAVVYLRGPAGIGKSALLASCLGTGSLGGEFVVWTRCTSYEAAVPLGWAGSLVKALLGLGATPGADGLRRALAGIDPAKAADPEAGAIFDFLLTGREDPSLERIEPEHRKAMLFRHIAELTRARTRRFPIALVIEDLHWMDDASAECLQALYLAFHKVPGPLLVAGSYRPGERIIPTPAGVLPIKELPLGPLAAVDARALVAGRIRPEKAASLDARAWEKVLERAGGNPRFLVALADAIDKQPDGAAVDVSKLPASVLGHLAARLDATALSGEGRLVLDGAAVFATGLTRPMLRLLVPAMEQDTGTGTPEGFKLAASGSVDPAVDELKAAKILMDDPLLAAGLAFADSLLQEAAYERILLKRRRLIHQLAGQLLEAHDAPPALIAEHFSRADEPIKAARWNLIAAERSIGLFSNHEALRQADLADNWADKAESRASLAQDFEVRLLQVRAAGLAAIGKLEEATECAKRLTFVTPHEDLGTTFARYADYLSRKGEHKEAIKACTRAIMQLGTTAKGMPWVMARSAHSILLVGEYDRAIEEARGVLAQAGDDDPKLLGFLHGIVGIACNRLKRRQEAAEAHHIAIEEYQRAGDLYGLAHALNNIGTASDALGRQDDAERYYNRGLQVATRIGDRRLISMLMNNLGMVVYGRGDVAKAKECFVKALEAHRDMHDRYGEGIALINVAEVTMGLGDGNSAQKYLLRAIMVLEEIGSKDIACEAYKLLIQIKTTAQEHSEAVDLLKRLAMLARDTGQVEAHGVALRQLSQAYQALSRPEDALAAAARAVAALKETDSTAELGRTYGYLAQLLRDSHAKQAAEAARQAAEMLGPDDPAGQEALALLQQLQAQPLQPG